MLKSSSTTGELPSTGVAEFDELIAGTRLYRRWVEKIQGRGFMIEEKPLMPGTAAELAGRILRVDPGQFRYVDLLHESRHVRQIERAELQGVDVFTAHGLGRMARAWLERGAYEYEQRLGARFGFSDEYHEFLERQLRHYWKRTCQQQFRFSHAVQQHLNRLWR